LSSIEKFEGARETANYPESSTQTCNKRCLSPSAAHADAADDDGRIFIRCSPKTIYALPVRCKLLTMSKKFIILVLLSVFYVDKILENN